MAKQLKMREQTNEAWAVVGGSFAELRNSPAIPYRPVFIKLLYISIQLE